MWPDEGYIEDAAEYVHTHVCVFCGTKWECAEYHDNMRNPQSACLKCKRIPYSDLTVSKSERKA